MKTRWLFTISALLFLTTTLQAQPDSLWSRTYGGDSTEICNSIIQTADGGFALGGYTSSFGNGDLDFWVVRTDKDGNKLWARAYGTESREDCKCLIQTSDGGFALAGNKGKWGQFDWWVVKTDSLGNSLWSKTYGSDGEDHCISIIQNDDNEYMLGGSKDGNIWLLRLDEDGDSLWSRTYGREDRGECCRSMISTVDGGFALAGYQSQKVQTFFGSDYYFDYCVFRIASNGDIIWSATYNGSNSDYCNSIIQTLEGEFILAGTNCPERLNRWVIWLLAVNSEGDSLWSQFIEAENNISIQSAIQLPDGGFTILGGNYPSNSWDKGNVMLLRFNAKGEKMWRRDFLCEGHCRCNAIIMTAEGEFALAGIIKKYDTDNTDFWLLKIGSESKLNVGSPVR